MNSDHIILSIKQGTTRDVYVGAASHGVPPQFPIGVTANLIATTALRNQLASAAGDNRSPAFSSNLFTPGTFSTDALNAALLDSMSSHVVPDRLMVEVRNIQRSRIGDISRDAGVIAVAPDMPIFLIESRDEAAVQTLADHDVTWGVKAVRADTSPFSGAGIVVAVLDTGIDRNHSAFAGVQLIEKDFTGEGNGDSIGHGTHCAGTIFGRSNGFGRIGVAPGVEKALIGKIIGQKKGGSSKTIASAIQWAVENGANVISMSIGMDYVALESEIEKSGVPHCIAVSRALEGYRANVQLFEKLASFIKVIGNPDNATILIAAAGNETDRRRGPNFEVGVSPPANAEGFVSVGAVGLDDNPEKLATAYFSNTGPNVSGPGVNITSAKVGGGLKVMSGTSMATPHVAGVAVLWAEKLKSSGVTSTSLLTAKLLACADSSGMVAGYDPYDVGAGVVMAPQA